MPLTVLSSHDDIRAALDQFLAADPVGGTILSTIAVALEDGAWAAADADLLAVRSAFEYPVVITGPWSDAARAELLDLLAEVPDVRGFSGAVAQAGPLIAGLGAGAHVQEQRLFRCDTLVPPTGVLGTAVVAEDSHRPLARRWVAEFVAEAAEMARNTDAIADRALDGGGLYLWVDAGEPVALAARRPVLAGSARIGPVYTPPEFRGRGYGSAVTAAATRSILDEAAVPVLFTDLANPTSNKIYRLLGYRAVEDRIVGVRA